MAVIRVLVNIFIIFSKENTQNCVFGGKLVFFDKIGNAKRRKIRENLFCLEYTAFILFKYVNPSVNINSWQSHPL